MSEIAEQITSNERPAAPTSWKEQRDKARRDAIQHIAEARTAITLPDESRPDARYIEVTHVPWSAYVRTCLPIEYVLAEASRGAVP